MPMFHFYIPEKRQKIRDRNWKLYGVLCIFCRVIADSFLTPFQECLDEWKKNLNQMEKDHAKGRIHNLLVGIFETF